MTIKPISFDEQYAAIRTGCGMVPLDDWSSVSVTGADRQDFLHNFCTNDIKRLTPRSSCEAFFTNVKGKIVGHGLVGCGDDEFVIVGMPGQSSPLIEHLDRYVIREDVQLRDTTAERAYVLLTGGAYLKECFGGIEIDLLSHQSRYVAWNPLGSAYGMLFELAPAQTPTLASIMSDRGFVLAGSPAFTSARVEAGLPLFGIDFDERNFPQEVGRNREAISFTKGCYLGQETVARIDALGHVNQRLVGVRFLGNEVPEPGIELLHSGKKAGQVTSATFSPRLNAPLALAMVRREANSPGTRLESAAGECEVVSLPVG